MQKRPLKPIEPLGYYYQERVICSIDNYDTICIEDILQNEQVLAYEVQPRHIYIEVAVNRDYYDGTNKSRVYFQRRVAKPEEVLQQEDKVYKMKMCIYEQKMEQYKIELEQYKKDMLAREEYNAKIQKQRQKKEYDRLRKIFEKEND